MNKNNITAKQIKRVKAKKEILDKVFGIWKDRNITLDAIRKEAWRRIK